MLLILLQLYSADYNACLFINEFGVQKICPNEQQIQSCIEQFNSVLYKNIKNFLDL